MLNLIRKDLICHKPALYGYLPVMAIYLSYLAGEVSSRGVFIVFSCIMSAILPMVLITREEKAGAEAFICSLPVTRRQVVCAKYVMCWALTLTLTLMAIVLYSYFAGEEGAEIWQVSTANHVLVILSLVLCFALPFSLRFGFAGLIGGLVGIQVVGILSLLLSKNLKTGISIKDIFLAVSEFIANTHAQLGAVPFFVALFVVLAILNLASCKIGILMFERREF
jgi:ABC-type transport system involved in multi-copper enzyme maturation permease subunit